MIEQKLTTYFSRYKRLAPRAEFLASSKLQITASSQFPQIFSWRQRILESVTTGGALAMASLLIVVVLGGVSYVSRQAGVVATSASRTVDTEALLKEASQLSSVVHINEVDQFNESSEQVVMALNKLAQQEIVK